MDTYFEQLVVIRKGLKEFMSLIGIWLADLTIIALLLLLLFYVPMVGTFIFAFIIISIYFAFKLSKRISIEYEYIFTNGTLDIDKIIAQSSRKRMMSFEISEISVIEKYNPAKPPVGNFNKKVIACNLDDENVYYLITTSDSKGKRLLVFSPDERTKDAIKKFLPRYMQMSAFKD